MQNTHSRTQLIGRAALVALLAAPALGAQGRWEDRDQQVSRGNARDNQRALFTWRGTVDSDVRISVRGRNVRSEVVSGSRTRRRDANVNEHSALPRRPGVVRVRQLEGRGRVYVVQQPSARNDYTAILQVRDWQGGTDRYRFVAYFDPVDDSRRTDRGGVRGDDGVWGSGGSRDNGGSRGNGGVWGSAGGDVTTGGSVLRWSGSVDDDLRISLRGSQIGYDVASGQQPQNVRSSGGQLPRSAGQLAVSLRQGRGQVFVIQQPSAMNNYTAVVRVLDRQGGYGYYDFDLVWR